LPRKSFWNDCLQQLEGELSSNHFNTWISPLQAEKDRNKLSLLAPNRFVKDWVEAHYLDRTASQKLPAQSANRTSSLTLPLAAVISVQKNPKSEILTRKIKPLPVEKKSGRSSQLR